jgi:acetyltransferase-like isoleucine patch superfamily enzyme
MPATYIHPTAIVDSREIGAGTRIWAFAHILEGAVIGCNCNIADRVFVEGGGRIGDNVTVKNNVCVWQGITIEDDVFVGPNVTFTNDRYPRSPRMPEVRHRYAETHRWLESTVLRRGCSVGANATVLPGIELGKYCVVAAAAVVTRNVEPFALVVGSPGRTVASVCRCGQRLDGSYDTSICQACDETPLERIKSLAA